MKNIQSLGLLVLISSLLVLSSCDKTFTSLSKYKVEEFNQFLKPARTHILIKSNDELFFLKDTAVGLVKITTTPGPKLNLTLSPDATRAAYTDTSGNVRMINVSVNTNERILHTMKGAYRIHWTNNGLLYGVTTDGKFKFNSQSFPVPSIPITIDTINGLTEKLYDAVLLPDGKVLYSKHYEAKNGQFFLSGDSIVVWNNIDSTSVAKAGYSEDDIPTMLQINKEGQLIGYHTDHNDDKTAAYVFALSPEFSNEIIYQSQQEKIVTAYKAHINMAYVSASKRELIIENKLIELYPEYAVDDTLSFRQINTIDDFDIQVPVDQYPQQTFSFD